MKDLVGLLPFALADRNKKRGVVFDSPFCALRYNADLELISVVYIGAQPVSTIPRSAIFVNPQVLLHGSREIGSIVPSHTTSDAHARGQEVPQIPLSDQVGAAVELTAIDRPASWNIARDVIAFEVCAHQNRSRRIRCAGQETLGTPQKQIVTDQEIMRPLLTPQRNCSAGRIRSCWASSRISVPDATDFLASSAARAYPI